MTLRRLVGCAALLVAASACAAPAVPNGRPETSPAGVASPAQSQVIPERPRRLVLPSGTMLQVDVVTADREGALGLPEDVDRAGWWRGSSRLGDPFGAVVIAGHVDSFAEGIGPIAEILDLAGGAVIQVGGQHLSRTYVVTSTRFVRRTRLAGQARLLSLSGDRRLVLITCGGPFDEAYDGYRDNVVLTARERVTP